MKINAKKAKKDFKTYCLTLESYFLSLKFSFKTIKILDFLKSKEQELLDTQAIIMQLTRELSQL